MTGTSSKRKGKAPPHSQDTFGHDKRTEIFNFGVPSPLDLFEFSPGMFFPFSSGLLCNLIRKPPQNVKQKHTNTHDSFPPDRRKVLFFSAQKMRFSGCTRQTQEIAGEIRLISWRRKKRRLLARPRLSWFLRS